MKRLIKPSFIMTFIFLLSACNNQVSQDSANDICSCPESLTVSSTTTTESLESSSSVSDWMNDHHSHDVSSIGYDEHFHTTKCNICGKEFHARHYFSYEEISKPARKGKLGKLIRYCKYCSYSEEIEYEMDDIYVKCYLAEEYDKSETNDYDEFKSTIKDDFVADHSERFYFVDDPGYAPTPYTQEYKIGYLAKDENDRCSNPRIYESIMFRDETIGYDFDSFYDPINDESLDGWSYSYIISAYFYPISDFSRDISYISVNLFDKDYGGQHYKITCYSGDDIFGYVYVTCYIKLPDDDYILNKVKSYIKTFN